MTLKERSRRSTRRIPGILVAGLLVVSAATAVALGHESPASPSPASPSSASRSPATEWPVAARPPGVIPRDDRGALDEADGLVPDGATVFDDEIPAVANLDPALVGALRRAATDASDVGVEFSVNSGWRSPAYQNQLLREAVSEYGSEEEAARWVATAETSAHVSGDAVGLGPSDTTEWLSENGADHGLCQIYRNEPWHFELRAQAIENGCPRMYADPTQDPRMHR